MNKKYKLTKEIHEEIFHFLELDMLSESNERSNPQIVILGGQPGAGKSCLAEIVKKDVFAGSTVTSINGDDYRDYHPNLQQIIDENDKLIATYTDPDVREWTKDLLASAVARRRDIIFESTLRSDHPIAETINDLHAKGYRVTVAVMFTPFALSRIGVIERYECQKEILHYGRWTDLNNHDQAFSSLPVTVRELENKCELERLVVCNRNKAILYCNERINGSFVVPDMDNDAASVIEKTRRQALSPAERDHIKKSTVRIMEQMSKRKASQQEIMEARAVLQNLDPDRR